MLQFLQYHQQLEKSSETSKFEDLVRAGSSSGIRTTTEQSNQFLDEIDEKAVEESLKVWYGLNNQQRERESLMSSAGRARTLHVCWTVVALIVAV